MTHELAVVTGIVLFSIALVYHVQRTQEDKKLPPGPPRLPFLGNLLQIPVLRSYPKFREWAKEYGPIFSLRLGPQTIIVLNTAEAAHELLDNRAMIYSGRAPPYVAHEIVGDGQRPVFLSYGKEWKAVRKSLQPSFTTSKTREMRTTQELESRIVLYDLMTHGEQSFLPEFRNTGNDVPEAHWFSIVRRFTTSVMMLVTYGNRVNRIVGNPRLHKIYRVFANVAGLSQPGTYLADTFPVLRKLPDILAPWRVVGRRMHEWEMELWGGFLESCKGEIREGKERVANYVSTYLRQRADAGIEEAPGKGILPNGHLTDKLLAYCAGTVLEAGSDTTASTVQSFILFMISHPHVLKKLREEIDSVVGDGRMPTFENLGTLPYLIACIKETLRRRPPAALGIPHSCDSVDNYSGYLIPKNSTVIGNVWAIHMDPVAYPNPFAFDPDRFMVKENKGTWASGPDSKERDHYVFGWGRRFCIGQNVAEAALFIVLSRIVWAFDLEVPKNPKSGNSVIPDINDEDVTFTDGLLNFPKAYPVAFVPRSENKAQIIRKAFEEAQVQWEYLGLDTDVR
ncbi:cytochrome p450 [Moniliophthora roreri MCA 2997]|uniref:Cytochrome p450 n=1 Tax=Moniliophthora roreri (strain MCA 2997) TaxID=1381753 RepID=V2XGP5_MONRO|nr:cytochrome p450 [Moniliophthora roreri MCA 2997]